MKAKERKLPKGIEVPPIELSDMAMDVWIKFWQSKQDDLKVLTVDYFLLAAFCHNYAVWMECSDYILDNGFAMTSKTGFRSPHPEVGIGNHALANCARLAKALGITPLSRKNLGIESKSIKEENPIKSLMKKNSTTSPYMI